MNPLALIPDKYLPLIKTAAAALAIVAAIWWWNSHKAEQQQIGYDRAMDEVAAAQQALADARREREDNDQGKADKEARNAQDQINDLERQRDAARADADRMRQQYRQAAERGRQALACAPGASPGEPGSDPLGVFIGLLERADQRAEEVAGYADRLRVAGLACERLYDKVSIFYSVSSKVSSNSLPAQTTRQATNPTAMIRAAVSTVGLLSLPLWCGGCVRGATWGDSHACLAA